MWKHDVIHKTEIHRPNASSNVARGDQSTSIGTMFAKFREARICGFWDMGADSQPDGRIHHKANPFLKYYENSSKTFSEIQLINCRWKTDWNILAVWSSSRPNSTVPYAYLEMLSLTGKIAGIWSEAGPLRQTILTFVKPKTPMLEGLT